MCCNRCNGWNSACGCNCGCGNNWNSSCGCGNNWNNSWGCGGRWPNSSFRRGYAAGFNNGYDTGFRDGFWANNNSGIMPIADNDNNGYGCRG